MSIDADHETEIDGTRGLDLKGAGDGMNENLFSHEYRAIFPYLSGLRVP